MAEDYDERLRELWASKITSKEIAAQLGKSLTAINRRAAKLELGHRPHKGGRRLPQLERGWTEEKLALLSTLWSSPDFTIDEIAERLGHTRGACDTKASVLGLHRPKAAPRWTDAENARLTSLWHMNVKVAVIVRTLGRTPGAIYKQAKKLGLPERVTSDFAKHELANRVPVTPEMILRPATDSLLVEFEQLEKHSCRWPIGEVGVEGFRFCGAAANFPRRPYCDHHHAIAHAVEDDTN